MVNTETVFNWFIPGFDSHGFYAASRLFNIHPNTDAYLRSHHDRGTCDHHCAARNYFSTHLHYGSTHYCSFTQANRLGLTLAQHTSSYLLQCQRNHFVQHNERT